MEEDKKTNEQQKKEIVRLRKKIAALENSEVKLRHVEEAARQKEEALRESAERFRVALKNAQITVFTQDRDLRFTWAYNPTPGFDTDKILGKTDEDLVGTEQAARTIAVKRRVLETGKGIREELSAIVDGKTLYYDLTVEPLFDENDEIVGIVCASIDIAERRQVEEELRRHRDNLEDLVIERTGELKKINKKLQEEISGRKQAEIEYRDSEEKFKRMTSSAKDAIIMLDNIGNIFYWNKAAKKIFGYSSQEALGKECHLLLGPKRFYDDYKKGFTIFMEAGKGPVIGKTLEVVAVKKDRTEFPVELSVSAVKLKGKWNAIGILRDITERKEMEEKLMRQEKLTILGQLAGGVGHELRNPLGAIKNAAYFLKIALEKPDPEVKETLELLEKEIATSERIISSLLGFARPRPPSRHKVDVQEVIDKVVLRTAIPEGIKVVTQFEKEMPHILADSGQLSQVFGNLFLNSIQAMPKGGKLVINSKLDNAEQIAISFTDTGEGIPREIIRKLFEPLFTTKAKGIGLGLAVTKTHIEGHGGTIEVESIKGKGSTFTVKLPISGKLDG